MRRIALATCSTFGELTPSDRTLVQPLEKHKLEAVAAPWDEETDWERFDAIILRSCWNYQRQPKRFRQWISHLVARRVPVWNPAPVVYWNMDKMYLKALAERGVNIIATHWVTPTEPPVNLKEILRSENWPVALVKPRIGASADFVWLTSLETAERDQPRFDAMLGERDVMIQPFLEEIRNGEWSLIFIDGQYSHAALKRPASGRYLVQANHGGTWELSQPSATLIEQARFVVKTALGLTESDEPFLYARVDGVEIEGSLYLMELELIEPELFMTNVTSAAERMARAIADRVELADHV